MSLANAGAFLLVASLKNRIKKQLIRLRQPRYLAASAMGGLYLWTVFVRRGGGPSGLMVAGPAPFEAFFLSMGLLSVAGSWIFGGEEGALVFSEAEATLLFSAPVTRAALMRYKLARTLLVAVFSALLMTLLAGRRMGASTGYFTLGAWLALSTLSLHLTAASLTRATLVRFGLTGLRRRLVTVGVMGAAVAALLYWAIISVKPVFPSTLSFVAAGEYLAALLAVPPLSTVLWPLRAPLEVAFATDLAGLWPALPLAVLLLLVHVAWVLSSDVAFEEASLVASEKRAARMQQRGKRGVLTVRRSPPPFALSSEGRPEVAILWKNLTALTRVVSVRLVLLVILVGVTFAALSLSSDDRPLTLAIGLLVTAAFTVLFSPQLVSADLRDDLPHLEILRTWPLSGRQIATGELLAPLSILSVALWAQIGAATALSLFTGGQPASLKIAAGLALMLLGPALAGAGLVVQNMAAILFPSWVGQDNQRGVEALGQRLLTMVGRVLVLTLGFFPAALLGGSVGALLYRFVGVVGLPVGAALTTAVLAAELYWALGVLGRAFERMDLSRD